MTAGSSYGTVPKRMTSRLFYKYSAQFSLSTPPNSTLLDLVASKHITTSSRLLLFKKLIATADIFFTIVITLVHILLGGTSFVIACFSRKI